MFTALKILPYKRFKKRINLIKRNGYNIIVCYASKKGKINHKKIIKLAKSDMLVLPKDYQNEFLKPYNYDEYLKFCISKKLSSFKDKTIGIINKNGLFLNLILPVIKNNKQVTIITENTKAFLSLSNKAQTLYGAEPVFADSLRESNGLDIVINLDTITDILRKSDITNDELLKDLDPLQLGSAFYLEKIDFLLWYNR